MRRNLTGLENPRRILSGFNGASTTSLGDIVLPVQAGPVTLNIQFLVVQDLSPFNIILGRTWLHYMKVIPSTYHQMVSFLTKDGQIDLYGSQLAARQCYQIAQEGIHPPSSLISLTSCQQQGPSNRGLDVFTPDRQKIIREEIEKLLEVGFIREVENPDWLANVVVFPSVTDRPNCGLHCWARMLSFLDAFSGYHQILMSSADEEKTTFITPHGPYCYKVMPFGLKNAGATYQRLMTKIFKPLVGRTVEVYIDDIVVKSKTREEHVLHLQEVFHLLRKYDMKLNSSKCAFGEQKELQRLTGKLVALRRFIARFTDKLRPLLLGNTKSWSERMDGQLRRNKVFKDGANSLGSSKCRPEAPPLLPSPPVVVLTDQPLRNILHKPDLTRKMLQWAIELNEYGIEFQPKLSMKGQVMADFVLEYSRRPIQLKEPSEKEWWTLRVDGASGHQDPE
ncbi:Transposon Ty3-I Gag-Pol polyprotein [Vitis vinifera]|uniref:Transposon Ty3-I Gag-Pol polyprotein n=1 Tax=Vitis vinifera TaxID=29760 RepID=A0A438EZH8_VITVI|nr:Transposon Ty3-I Gag-Pol polyprotein [Vitis vinifera]